MRLKNFTAVFSAVLSAAVCTLQSASACGLPMYQASEYCLFRVHDGSAVENTDERTLNCELWRNLTSKDIPLEDIYRVVYKYSSRDIEHIPTLFDGSKSDTLMQNAFVRWIVRHSDSSIVDCLTVAKLCEETRMVCNDPWYYPVENDRESVTLAELAHRAESYDGWRLRDRYALQAVRALFASGRYDACINYWNRVRATLPEGLIKGMIRPYIAGAYYRMGFEQEALKIYADLGDVESILYCLNRQGQKLDRVERIELLYEYNSDMLPTAATIQHIVEADEYYRSDDPDDRYNIELLRLREFACRVAREGRAANRAMWYYTAAYIYDMYGDPQTASALCSKAERSEGTPFIKESVKVLRIYLDAKLCRRCDAASEQRLLGQLQWLDDKIWANIDDDVRQTDIGDYTYNRGFYYWNDAMRRILISVVVPRYLECGNYVRAIQLTNMADNDLLNAVGSVYGNIYDCRSRDWEERSCSLPDYRRSATKYNSLDYCRELFHLVDTVGLDHVITYRQQLDRPRTRFDRFVNSRSYTDTDYFDDLIGTQCLREMRYGEAVEYLGRVSPTFQQRLNTCKEGLMNRDPFSLYGTQPIADNADYKYEFARRMLSLEQTIEKTADPDRKARLQIKYAVGLYNSIHSCWALTQYYYNFNYDWRRDIINSPDFAERASWRRADERCRRLLDEADAMFSDRSAAKAAYNRLGDYGTDWHCMTDQTLARYVNQRCDRASDYREHGRLRNR